MVSNPTDELQYANSLSAAKRREILHSLVPIASCAANAQLDAFSLRLTNALIAFSEHSNNPKQANLCFAGASLLKKNTYAYYYLASVRLEELLRQEIQAVSHESTAILTETSSAGLTLVSFAEMDNKVLLGNIARPLVVQYSDQLEALGRRLACLFDRDDLPLNQHPFRPENFMSALNAAWTEFDPDTESHPLILPLLQPDVFLDLAPILQALNEALIAHGVLPSLTDSYRIKKASEAAAAEKKTDPPAQSRQLQGGPQQGGQQPGAGAEQSLQAALQNHLLQMTAVSNQLLGFLSGMQKNLLDRQLTGLADHDHSSTAVLANIKTQAPPGVLTQVDENTIDLLAKVFDMIFRDQNIAAEMKALIGLLQVPVLKAALIDKEFFFKQEHPARRLVESLAQSSMEWDRRSGESAPLYQTMKNIVERVQQDFDQEITVFSDVVSDLDSFVKAADTASTESLQAPISRAIKREKLGQATKVAKSEVAMRVGTGEVVAFVETFLENKWVSVLTVAYTLQEEKPQAVASAMATMDDLIWSVKPKITMDQRKELLAKLPSILSRLNKWLNVVKWTEADRVQFFADLAETHASIVRAPLPLTPQRQMELAVDIARQAAERRLAKSAAVEPEPAADEFDAMIKQLERGIWLNFTSSGGEVRKAKLSWISPMRSLFIFTSHKKEETFQLSDNELAKRFREGRVQTVLLNGLVDRALSEAFAIGAIGANDANISQKSAA